MPEMKEKYPELTRIQLSKKISVEYKNMSDKKRESMKKIIAKNMEKFRKQKEAYEKKWGKSERKKISS